MLLKFFPSERWRIDRFLANHTNKVAISESSPSRNQEGRRLVDQSHLLVDWHVNHTVLASDRPSHHYLRYPGWWCWGSRQCSPPGSESLLTSAVHRGTTWPHMTTHHSRARRAEENQRIHTGLLYTEIFTQVTQIKKINTASWHCGGSAVHPLKFSEV